jgi:hypothetical protein
MDKLICYFSHLFLTHVICNIPFPYNPLECIFKLSKFPYGLSRSLELGALDKAQGEFFFQFFVSVF